MKNRVKPLSLFLSACLILAVSPVFSAEEKPGYDDGPFLPDSPWRVHDRNRPQPPIVLPGTGDLGATPPGDALALFDGKNLDEWSQRDGKPIDQGLDDGTIDVLKTGNIQTRRQFGDCQVHLEWKTPSEPENRMNWGNSGVFMMGVFEIQILESHDSYVYADGNAGAIYGQFPPLVNPARPAGEWQSFDIFFTAPVFEGDKMVSPAHVTVVYNGVVVQNHQAILGAVAHRALPGPYPKATKGPITLQDHKSSVQFRNIWIRPLDGKGFETAQ